MPITQQEIEELRTSTPKATIADITTGEPPYDPAITPHISRYLSLFAAPKRDADGKTREGQPCIACDAVNSFTWGLAHGSGHCTQCGWPATLYHFIRDDHDQEILTIRGVLLWDHPDNIEVRKPA